MSILSLMSGYDSKYLIKGHSHAWTAYGLVCNVCHERCTNFASNFPKLPQAEDTWITNRTRHIDLLLDVWIRLGVPENEYPRTRAKQRRVGSDRDDIGLLERRKVLFVAINAEIGATSAMSSAPSWSAISLNFPGSTTRGRQKHRTESLQVDATVPASELVEVDAIRFRVHLYGKDSK